MADRRQAYIYEGNTVRRTQTVPKRQEEYIPSQPQKRVSKQVRRNRRKAMHMSAGYVVFLAAAAITALVVCMSFLKLQTQMNQRSNKIAEMQEDLADMREANNTRKNAVMDSVNLEDVRNRAVSELGMVYASPDQIVEYDSPTSDYIKQYQEIPEDGIAMQ